MMKILHTADWHLGKRLDNFSRLEEQREVLNEICEIAANEKVDAVLIAGDLYDTFNPPTEAIELFYHTLKRLSRNAEVAVIAIAGNHDSADRIDAPDPLARENAIFFVGSPNGRLNEIELESGVQILRSDEGFLELKLPNSTRPLRILLTPYANEPRMQAVFKTEDSEQELRIMLANRWKDLANRYCDSSGINILLAHHFFVKNGSKVSENTDEERPILHVGGAQTIDIRLIPPQIHYTALGHLHRFQDLGTKEKPVVYSGSPLSYSFGEANQDKFVLLLEDDDGGKIHYRKLRLKKGKRLYRKRFEAIRQAEEWLEQNPHCLVELTLVCENYLSLDDKNRLLNIHGGIVSIIPEIQSEDSSPSKIDLTQDIETLFKKYFRHQKNREASEEILDLFRELLSEGGRE